MDRSTRNLLAIAALGASCLAGKAEAQDPNSPLPIPFPVAPSTSPPVPTPPQEPERPATRVPPPPRPGQAPATLPPAVPQRGDASAAEINRRLRVDPDGRISLHMDDLDVRRALEVLSRQGSLNILLSPGVSGRVTANLESATVDEALNAILRLANLTARREGNLIYVYSPAEFRQLAFQNQEVETRIYKLNYIRANDLLLMLRDLLSPDGTMTATPANASGINDSPSFSSTGSPGGGGGGGGGAGGAAGGAPGTAGTGGNSMAGGDVVIVRDYKANLRAIDEVVLQLDIPPTQVLVEAVILSVDLERSQELGVNYAVVDNLGKILGTIGSGTDLANVGFQTAKLLTVPADASAASLAAAGRINGSAGEGGFNSSTNGIKFGYIGKNNAVFIRALESLGEVRVLASPRILVLNKQKAEIQLGQRLGYFTNTQNFTTTTQLVQFLNTGTLLRLRPFVSSDGMVRMEIHPERSSGTVINNVPSQNTSELTTNVMVPDGATLIIGGLIENERDYQQQGLPGLNRVPLLGAAFGFKARTNAKRELIVMLTPHIWRPSPDICPPPGAPSAPIPGGAYPGTGPAGPGAPAPADGIDPPDGPGPLADRIFPRPGEPTRHVVRKGEDLWSIAKQYYGSGQAYLTIWDANRDKVESPDALKPGTTLIIPPKPASAEAARRGAPGKSEPPSLRPGSVRLQSDPIVDPDLLRSSYEGAGSNPSPIPTTTAYPDPGARPRMRPLPPTLPSSARGEGDSQPSPSVREGRAGGISGGARGQEWPADRAETPTALDRRREAPAGDDGPIHVVGRFDTLKGIARDRLGDARRAGEILALNRGVVAAGDRLTAGQILRLPRDARPARSGR